jgi:hypothetical protein
MSRFPDAGINHASKHAKCVEAASPKRSSEIEQAMHYLQCQLERASKLASEMNGKLSPVLMPAPPTGDAQSSPSYGSPLAAAIQTAASHLESINHGSERTLELIAL